jgi:hypothetical protein
MSARIRLNSGSISVGEVSFRTCETAADGLGRADRQPSLIVRLAYSELEPERMCLRRKRTGGPLFSK